MTLEFSSQDLDVLNEQGKCVLIVEDDRDIRSALQTILEEEGYDVFVAQSGSAALKLMPRIPKPSLILLDLMMPDMNGWEFSEALAKDDCYGSIPVMVVSAYTDKTKLKDIKCKELIKKPIDLDVLLPKVKGHLLDSWFGTEY
ncbi:MAG: response regulator [Bdellovibrionota bacterium]